jgi:hypothetical protein
MKNLHLKNLKKLDLYDLNMEQINKTKSKNKRKELINLTLKYLINKLEHLVLINPTINDFKNYYLNDIKTEHHLYTNKKTLQNIKNYLEEFNNIKNTTIESTININEYNHSIYYDDKINDPIYEINLLTIYFATKPNEISTPIYLKARVLKNIIVNINYF